MTTKRASKPLPENGLGWLADISKRGGDISDVADIAINEITVLRKRVKDLRGMVRELLGDWAAGRDDRENVVAIAEYFHAMFPEEAKE